MLGRGFSHGAAYTDKGNIKSSAIKLSNKLQRFNGVSDLYNTERNIMTVQPIYDTEGQSMVATAFASVEAGGLGATKLGVIATTDEAGKGMLNGIKIEAQKLGKSIVL